MIKKRFSTTLTEPYLEALDRLVEAGVYANQGEAIKEGLRTIFKKYNIEPFNA